MIVGLWLIVIWCLLHCTCPGSKKSIENNHRQTYLLDIHVRCLHLSTWPYPPLPLCSYLSTRCFAVVILSIQLKVEVVSFKSLHNRRYPTRIIQSFYQLQTPASHARGHCNPKLIQRLLSPPLCVFIHGLLASPVILSR